MDNFTIMPPLAGTIHSFATAFGRANCTGGCYAEDMDDDRDVDGKDLATFSALDSFVDFPTLTTVYLSSDLVYFPLH